MSVSITRQLANRIAALRDAITGKQDTLVSGSTIKTIGGASLVGSGDVASIGAMAFTGAVTVSDANFTIQDDADATKQAQFQLSGITTATTRAYTLPNADGTLALVSGLAQTFANTTTFSGTTVTVGTSTSASTLGLGTGATTNGTTKTVNIGTAGVSGSITNINIGSTVSGATGTVQIGSKVIKQTALTVANLVSAATAGVGARSAVSDSTLAYTSANVGTNVTGGGANWCPVWSDGTNWKIG